MVAALRKKKAKSAAVSHLGTPTNAWDEQTVITVLLSKA
jgi:hypothetical protein